MAVEVEATVRVHNNEIVICHDGKYEGNTYNETHEKTIKTKVKEIQKIDMRSFASRNRSHRACHG